jgi:CHAT domain-containing protein
MRSLEDHLSPQELVSLPESPETLASGGPEQQQLSQHLQPCEACYNLAQTYWRLRSLRAPIGSGNTSWDCPTQTFWLEYAAGLWPDQPFSLTTHVAGCITCATALLEALELMRPDQTDQFDLATEPLKGLASSTPEWQRKLAAELSRTIPSGSVDPPPLRAWEPSWLTVSFLSSRLAVATAFAGLIAFGTWFALHLEKKQSAGQLIADAYTEKRNLEVRIEGVPYVQLRQERGMATGQSRMNRPALLKAEAEIAQQLKSHPDDVLWLQASGRASLLEDDSQSPEAAVGVLQKAHLLAPNDQSISIDLASAYIQRGQILNRPEDYGAAVEILGKIVGSPTKDETAQFNYAIALERLLLKAQAAEAWEGFLKLYPKSPWAGEARDHLNRLQQEIRERSERSDKPLRNADQLAAAFDGGDDKELSDIDGRIEEYLDVAIQEWLPKFFSLTPATAKPAGNLDRALYGVAQLLAIRHNDPWLRDLLSASRYSPTIRDAVLLLADSERSIRFSDDDRAQRDAVKATSLFRHSRVPAGQIRAQFLLVFIDQLRHRKRPCEATAQTLYRDPQLRRYSWIFVQSELEAGICANESDGRALRAVQSGLQTAIAHHYPILILRASMFESQLYWVLGDQHHAWSTSTQGLRAFWSGAYPKLRGYNFLISMDDLVTAHNQWFLEAAILKEATPMVVNDPRTNMVASEQARLGQVLLQSGDIGGAERCFQRERQLFETVAPGIQRNTLIAEAELGFARVDFERGQLDAAVSRLEQVRSTVTQVPDDRLVLDFFETSGITQLRLRHLGQAEVDLDSAIQLAEKGLHLVDTEEDGWKWSRRNEPVYRALVELKLQTDPKQALFDWESYKGSALRSRRVESAQAATTSGLPIPFANEKVAAFSGMDDATALISYALFPNGAAVWVWDENGVRERWISIPILTIAAQARRFAENCADPHSDPQAIRQEGAALYQQILLPIEPWIAGRRHLIIEPDGVLDVIPVGLLVDSRGEYLGDRFTVSISPGIAYLNESRKWAGISPASDVLVVGDPEVPGWRSLPDAEQEAHAVAASFLHPRLFTQSDSSQMNLPEEVARAQVFHFSGHAATSLEHAGLVAGMSGVLDAFPLGKMRHGRTQLVVLSACSSSQGTSGLFDDEDSMVTRLMTAHVPEVVASRWMVDSTATSLLMTKFYSELLAGVPVSQALESAMRSVRARSEFSHPYYWAGFSVFGLT